MHADPAITMFVGSILLILGLGILMRKLRQPHVIVYLLAGIILGPSGFGAITDQALLARLGTFGVIFLLFFIGMEVSPGRLVKNWFISVTGTILQVIMSIGLVFCLGHFLDWSIARIVLLGFVISLSSTAVVLKLLTDWNEIDTRTGQNVLGILLVQDILVAPMLICLSFLGGHHPTLHSLILQIVGGIFLVGIVTWLVIKETIHLPWLKIFGSDHEMQFFLALGICFTMAMLTGYAELSSALGAFVAGMIVSSAKETHWVHHSLLSMRTVFIAIFFVSIGMLIDISFITQYWWQITLIVLAAFGTNMLLNAAILKALGESWDVSLYAGALLSQIGEFSFVVASIGFQGNIINGKAYQMTITIIALTLMLSPLWIMTTRKLTHIDNQLLHTDQ